jgi:hypothetical protein
VTQRQPSVHICARGCWAWTSDRFAQAEQLEPAAARRADSAWLAPKIATQAGQSQHAPVLAVVSAGPARGLRSRTTGELPGDQRNRAGLRGRVSMAPGAGRRVRPQLSSKYDGKDPAEGPARRGLCGWWWERLRVHHVTQGRRHDDGGVFGRAAGMPLPATLADGLTVAASLIAAVAGWRPRRATRARALPWSCAYAGAAAGQCDGGKACAR